MGADIMNGYTAYASPGAIVAEGMNATGDGDDDLITISVSVSVTVTVSVSWSWTWYQ